MSFKKIFPIQKKLDDRIVEQHGLEGQDLLLEKILALQVELGELANEHRGFKFWSKDQKPRTCIIDKDGETANQYYRNPLLEEYVDCIHFFISIALELEIDPENFEVTEDYTQPTTTLTFNRVFSTVSSLDILLDPETPCSISKETVQETLREGFSCFIGLGEMLGFTWQQIEDAYLKKNEVNHQRQDGGY